MLERNVFGRNVFERVEIFLTGIGRWAGFILSCGAVWAAGPFPVMNQGLRLGSAIGLAVVVILLTRPLAGQFPGSSARLRTSLWIVDLVVLIGFIFTLFNFFEIYESFWDGVFILETPS